MINDPVLINDWHPVATVEELEAKNLLAVRLLGEDLVIWRANGRSLAWQSPVKMDRMLLRGPGTVPIYMQYFLN